MSASAFFETALSGYQKRPLVEPVLWTGGVSSSGAEPQQICDRGIGETVAQKSRTQCKAILGRQLRQVK